MKKSLLLASLLRAICCLVDSPRQARAEFLFDSYLVPSFSTQYSAWDVFYTPYNNFNYPDFAAPYGAKGPAPAGYTIPANANPSNPLAYWDTRNATITQTAPGVPGAFITSPGVSGGGNIYSFSSANAYALTSGSVAANYGLVELQFQTDGSLLDFNTLKLRYTDSTGAVVTLPPNDLLREYRTSGSSFGGVTNRSAAEWNLTGLGVTSYQITFNSPTTSNSFQQAALDTAPTYGTVIPPLRSWNAVGTANWSSGSSWQQGSTSNENGNVRFINAQAATPVLDANHTVGEIRFDTAAAVTINSPGGFVLTSNTGLTNTAAATGIYTLNANYQLGAYNIFDLAAGDVRLTRAVSGNYGLEKDGAGSLTLAGNNTFTGGLAVGAGTLTLSGSNLYTAPTQVAGGALVVAAGGSLANTQVTVNSGATFINNGAVAGSVNVSGSLGGAGVFNGAVTFLTGSALANASAGAFNNGVTVSQGVTVALSGGTTVVARGAITNDGTLRFTRGATLDASGATSIINNGTLDFLSGNLILPPGISITNGSNGRVLTRNLLTIHNVITKTATQTTVRCDGYAGHTYQLQKSNTLANASYTNVGNWQTVTTDTAASNQLSFDDPNPGATQGFYRVQVDP